MFESWKTRLFFSGLLLGFAIYLLIPTVIYFNLNESQLREVRRDKHAFAKMLPSWSIDSHIIPGLDLQGGIHMVLGVDVDKALKDRAARTAERLKDYAKDQKVAFIEVKPDLIATFANKTDLEAFVVFSNKKIRRSQSGFRKRFICSI